MRLKYGQYPHAENECKLSRRLESVYSELGVRREVRERWDIEGMLFGADAPTITTLFTALQVAYAIPGQDIGFFDNNGNPTVFSLKSANTLGGVRVIVPPSCIRAGEAEYTSWLTYSLAVEATLADLTTPIVSWDETIETWGGGPRYVWTELRNGAPQKEQVSQQTTYKARQTGTAAGLLFWPTAPPPVWPGYYLPANSGPAAKRLAKRRGTFGTQFTDFPISWSYNFEADVPLYGNPTPAPI